MAFAAMHGGWTAGLAAIAISLSTLPASAAGTSRMLLFAQTVSDTGRGAAAASQPPASQPPANDASAPLPANSPEQIRKAQTELRRLDCLKGRIDGKLGDQTRQAVKKFWASAKQPTAEVTITDELISSLAESGDGYCRPARPFFAIGGRSGGNSAPAPFFLPGSRPAAVPAPAAPPPPP
jgi:peptidoglycan hydrolase-like protein with peptidoglycan-binding domain